MLDKKNFYINGKWISPEEARNYKVIDPSNEEPCAEISLGGKKDVDKAVSAAKKAFVSWAFTKYFRYFFRTSSTSGNMFTSSQYERNSFSYVKSRCSWKHIKTFFFIRN